MKKHLLWVLCFILSAQSIFAYDVEYRNMYFDIVGTDQKTGLTMVELVNADTSIIQYSGLAIPGYFSSKYIVVGIKGDAFTGASIFSLHLYDLLYSTFTFGARCFKDCNITNLSISNFFVYKDPVKIIFEEDCFANATSETEDGFIQFSNPVEIHKGAFVGYNVNHIRFNNGSFPTLYGGAFDSNVKKVTILDNVTTLNCDTEKVFAGLEEIVVGDSDLPTYYPVINNILDITDFSKKVTIDLSSNYQLINGGKTVNNVTVVNSTLKVPYFLADAYAKDSVWSAFKGKIESITDNFVTDSAGIIYHVKENTFDLVNGNAAKGAVTIPQRLCDEYPDVKPSSIYTSAFQGNKEITSLTMSSNPPLQDAFFIIGAKAFADCPNLTSASLFGVSIRAEAFFGTPLTKLEIPYNGISSMGNTQCFNGTITILTLGSTCDHCLGLTWALSDHAVIYSEVMQPQYFPEQAESVYSTAEVSVPYGTIDLYRTTECWNKFANITERPYNSTSFNDGTFLYEVTDTQNATCMLSKLISHPGTNSITVPMKVIAPDGREFRVSRIGSEAFLGTDFTHITLPATLDTIDRQAFAKMPNLESMNLPESVKSIGYAVFGYCSALKSVKLSAGMTELPAELFNMCKSLESVNLPEGLIRIKRNAFFGCINLKTLSLPASLKFIEDKILTQCNLDILEFKASDEMLKISQSSFDFCLMKELRVMRPIGVFEYKYIDGINEPTKQIDETAIMGGGYEFIKKIVVGEQTKTLEWLPTKDNYSISTTATLESKAMTPPVLRAFDPKYYDHMTIEVPASALEIYRASEIWKEFKNYKTTGIEGVVATNRVTMIVADGNLTLHGAEGAVVEVSDLTGRQVTYISEYAGESIALSCGIYIVKADNTTLKVRM